MLALSAYRRCGALVGAGAGGDDSEFEQQRSAGGEFVGACESVAQGKALAATSPPTFGEQVPHTSTCTTAPRRRIQCDLNVLAGSACGAMRPQPERVRIFCLRSCGSFWLLAAVEARCMRNPTAGEIDEHSDACRVTCVSRAAHNNALGGQYAPVAAKHACTCAHTSECFRIFARRRVECSRVYG